MCVKLSPGKKTSFFLKFTQALPRYQELLCNFKKKNHLYFYICFFLKFRSYILYVVEGCICDLLEWLEAVIDNFFSLWEDSVGGNGSEVRCLSKFTGPVIKRVLLQF